ncbi:MAG TPA: amidohydrolase family protein [Flavitalea sp.]|nr:amidohydrolase family protein [Flavitalea sp.]
MKFLFSSKKLRALVAFVCVLFTGFTPPQKSSDLEKQQTILLYHVNIVDVVTGKISRNKAILITNNRIEAIAEFNILRSKNRAARAIDAKGKYAIPGLWDMHVHIEGSELVEDNLALFPVFVAYGVTTVRDMASDLGVQVLSWRDQINQGKIFGPRIFTAGIKIEGIGSKWKGDMEIANEQDLKEKLDSLVNYKVDFIKITENALQGDLFLKSVIAAKKLGFKVSGHLPIDLSITDLEDAGYNSVEHGSYLLRLGSDEQKIASDVRNGLISKQEASRLYREHFDQQKAIQGYRKMAAKHVAVCPTFSGSKLSAFPDSNDHRKDDYLKFLTKRFQSNYDWRDPARPRDTESQVSERQKNFQLLTRQLPLMQSAGMLILAGTDAAAMNDFIYPGYSLHQELEIYQDGGMSPLAVLQSATINGATFLSVSDSLATVEPGKIADIVLLNENPLHDIRATKNIFAVIKSGVYFDRAALDSLLDSAKRKKVELDAKRGE